jgi:hypothetical protein
MSGDVLSSLLPTAIPAEDEALRKDIRAFLRQATGAMSPERRARSWSGFDADFSLLARRMSRREVAGK